MAFVDRKNAKIYWNSLGAGEPVVLIMGLGCSSAMWFRIAPQLASHVCGGKSQANEASYLRTAYV
ncbi:MAG: hypothetical protein RL109_2136 [Pseudomonadota bacterium]